jgi:hypothetical protein
LASGGARGWIPERLVDHRVERDDAPDELASLGFRVRQLRLGEGEHAAKSTHDLGCKSCK